MFMFRATPKTSTKILMSNNVVPIVSNARFMQNLTHKIYKSIPHYIPTSLRENSFSGHHTSNTQKIKGIMTSKARIYVSMKELQAALPKLPAKYFELEDAIDRLYLPRQNGYHKPADIHKKFKDKSSQLSTQEADEEILLLDEACDVSDELLLIASLNCIVEQSKIMENTSLHNNPYHKNFGSLLVQNFLHNVDVSLNCVQDLDNVKEWLYEVQDLAKRNFDMAQMVYTNEVQQLSIWGNVLNLNKELHFARIEPFKWCMWSMGILPELDMSEERLELAKAISFIYMIDDIYDGYGTYDELYLFTEAINRWESADVTQLPNCMKVCFKALLETTNDFSSKIQTKHGWNPQQCLRKLWAEQCNAYFNELKWSVDKYSPSPEEYLNNGIISSGTHVVLAHAFFLLGKEINKTSLEELNSLPSIISSTATILRLWNDAGNHMDRTPNGEDGSYVDWYMKDHKISSYDIARKHVSQKISDAWKCLNMDYMSSTSPFSKDFKAACLNLARLVPIMYSQDDSHHLQFMVEPKNLLRPSDKIYSRDAHLIQKVLNKKIRWDK